MTPRRGPLSTHNVRVCLLFSFASFFKSFYHSFFSFFFPDVLLYYSSLSLDARSFSETERVIGRTHDDCWVRLFIYIREKKKNRKRQALLARGFLMARHTHETENCWTANTTLFYFPSPYTLILHIFPSSDIKWKI